MITPNNNPMIMSSSQPYGIFFAQTRDTLTDSEIYLQFLRSAENRFKSSRFYKAYKCELMNMGLYRDQRHAAITSEMANIEMHHNFITLEFMAIMLTEYTLNTKGCITTFELVQLLEEQHKNNRISVVMLSETEHEMHHNNPSDFISLKQCFGNPFEFIEKYISGMTLDICFKLLLHLKQEEQHGKSLDTNMVRAREEILSWQQYIKNVQYQY